MHVVCLKKQEIVWRTSCGARLSRLDEAAWLEDPEGVSMSVVAETDREVEQQIRYHPGLSVTLLGPDGAGTVTARACANSPPAYDS